ncbi:Lauroyl/myristoyl acyltransferase [Acidovorax sp. CF316]|uniref:lysophospholipid acyltransferase family protein n=1 Tax=Acidovorax sp. CF316 TaxID=1144317 RepID=UPI00026BD32B|nr:lysophospholipid acyltransferase family protein [Acidovorax sp. CF316]EJE53629.1 Lauroyl/myristoyl acyltransferase [Acidovorax sp. CF316]
MKQFPRWLSRSVARLDYGLVLPLLARLPRWLARPLWILRGCINYAMDWDWRTLSLGHGYVREATQHAMAQLRLQAQEGTLPRRLTLRRFVCMSREEVEAARLSHLDRKNIQARIIGLEALVKARDSQQGVVLMTAHFDSLYVGLAALAEAGLTVNLMSTKLTDDAMVPPAISQHFATKAVALNRLLAPGRVTHFEDSMRFFVSALRRGEIVVIACDGPSTSQDRSQPVDFLGAQRRMASGPQFLARAGHAPLALYTCQEGPGGHFTVEVTEPVTLENGGLQQAYSALERHLLAHPWQWWAADLYRTYVAAEATGA